MGIAHTLPQTNKLNEHNHKEAAKQPPKRQEPRQVPDVKIFFHNLFINSSEENAENPYNDNKQVERKQDLKEKYGPVDRSSAEVFPHPTENLDIHHD